MDSVSPELADDVISGGVRADGPSFPALTGD